MGFIGLRPPNAGFTLGGNHTGRNTHYSFILCTPDGGFCTQGKTPTIGLHNPIKGLRSTPLAITLQSADAIRRRLAYRPTSVRRDEIYSAVRIGVSAQKSNLFSGYRLTSGDEGDPKELPPSPL